MQRMAAESSREYCFSSSAHTVPQASCALYHYALYCFVLYHTAVWGLAVWGIVDLGHSGPDAIVQALITKLHHLSLGLRSAMMYMSCKGGGSM